MSNTRTTRTPAAKKAAAKRTAKKATPAKKAAPAKLSEQMAAEAFPARKPAGSPNLFPFMALPAREKADFMGKFAEVLEEHPDLESLTEVDEESLTLAQRMQLGATVYALVADMQDCLRMAAEDVGAFDAWCAKTDERGVMDLFMWYMRRFQPGEAAASPS